MKNKCKYASKCMVQGGLEHWVYYKFESLVSLMHLMWSCLFCGLSPAALLSVTHWMGTIRGGNLGWALQLKSMRVTWPVTVDPGEQACDILIVKQRRKRQGGKSIYPHPQLKPLRTSPGIKCYWTTILLLLLLWLPFIKRLDIRQNKQWFNTQTQIWNWYSWNDPRQLSKRPMK